jgi:hypothetical protein
MATQMVNEHRFKQDLGLYTKSVFATCIKRLKPLVAKVAKQKQGELDPTAGWSRARKNWVTQLLVRLSEIESQKNIDGTIPDYFNSSKMD